MYCGQNNQTLIDGGVPTTPPMNLPLYTCSISTSENGTWVPDGGTLTPGEAGNGTSLVNYNQLATLLFSPGEACAAPSPTPGMGNLIILSFSSYSTLWGFFLGFSTLVVRAAPGRRPGLLPL